MQAIPAQPERTGDETSSRWTRSRSAGDVDRLPRPRPGPGPSPVRRASRPGAGGALRRNPMNRRHFLRSLGGSTAAVAAGGLLRPEALLGREAAPEGGEVDAALDGEDFWFAVERAFPVNRSILYLGNGNVSPSAPESRRRSPSTSPSAASPRSSGSGGSSRTGRIGTGLCRRPASTRPRIRS